MFTLKLLTYLYNIRTNAKRINACQQSITLDRCWMTVFGHLFKITQNVKKMFTLKIADFIRINTKRIHLNLYYVFQLSWILILQNGMIWGLQTKTSKLWQNPLKILSFWLEREFTELTNYLSSELKELNKPCLASFIFICQGTSTRFTVSPTFLPKEGVISWL